MKTIIFIIFEVLIVSPAHSQQFRVAPYIEKTVAGSQFGTQFVIRTKSNWNFGSFYQVSLQHTSEGLQLSNSFFGATVSAPLVKSDKINFLFNTRCGVVDQQFVVVVPGLETEVRVSNTIGFSTMMSVRMSYPSGLLKLNFNF